ETRDLPEIFRRTANELEAHEAIGGPTQPAIWIGGGGCYPQTATSGPELWGQTAKLTREARRKRAGTLILPASPSPPWCRRPPPSPTRVSRPPAAPRAPRPDS